jgi:hypothetical protein
MAFADWMDFTSEFMSTFCPENEAMSTLMCLELDRYFWGQHNVEVYIDKFKDLVDMSGYTDPIAIVLKFRQGLNATMQDKIAESETDRPQDDDHHGWYAAAHRFDLNQLANEAFCYASQHPTAQLMTPRYDYPMPVHTLFSLSTDHLVDLVPCIHAHPYEAIPPNVDGTKTQNPATLTCY